MKKKQKITLYRIIITAVMLVVLQFLPIAGIPRLIAYLAAYLVIGYDILRKAGKGILNGRAFDENFLMALATLGAFFLAIWTKSGDYLEGIAVMLFYQIGELFQSYAVGKSRKNISALMDIRPDYANIEKDGKLEQVDPDEVAVGSIIVVQPGEKVPLDGVVESGNASLNTSALTGESLPRDVKEGDEIISGCINLNGVLKIRTTKEFGESTVSKILDLVENASSRKSRSEAFISRFAKIYTPAVCISAVLLGIAVPLLRMAFGMDAAWVDWIYRALTFLVVSCPCALVISIPLSFFAGIGGASHEGVLIKGSNYLEALSDAKIVVFDKTGTLTQGVFEVSAVHHTPIEQEKLLEYAALAECASSHPISKSLQRAYGKEIDRSRVSDIEEISGHGITAVVDGHTVAAGNAKLMKKVLPETKLPESEIGTQVYVAYDGKYVGSLEVADVIKEDSKEAVSDLRAAGVQKIVMLTGDARKAALQLAQQTQWRNKAVSDLYEPGSVFKLITCAAALDAGAITKHSSFYCGESISVAGTRFHCANHKRHGAQSVTQALENSCNQSFIQIGGRLGREAFCDYFAAFGLREPTGIDLPAEPKKSLYYTADRMGPVELASCAFGQSSKISYMEMAAAVCAVVNGGRLMQPYLVSDILNPDGSILQHTEPVCRRQVIKPETSETMREMMEAVVLYGGGRNARIQGYRVGGKSGTSQKLDSADEKARIASFVAVAPIDDPQFLCLDRKSVV